MPSSILSWLRSGPLSRQREHLAPRGTTRPRRPRLSVAASLLFSGPELTTAQPRPQPQIAPRRTRRRPWRGARARSPLIWRPFPPNQTAGTSGGASSRWPPRSAGTGRGTARVPCIPSTSPPGIHGDGRHTALRDWGRTRGAAKVPGLSETEFQGAMLRQRPQVAESERERLVGDLATTSLTPSFTRGGNVRHRVISPYSGWPCDEVSDVEWGRGACHHDCRLRRPAAGRQR
jgi:hypothetical protein